MIVSQTVYLYRIIENNSLSHQFNVSIMGVIESVIKKYIDYFKEEKITSFLREYYLYSLKVTVEKLMSLDKIDYEKKKEIILSLLNNDFLHSISFTKLLFTTKSQRRMNLLLIGDIDLIMDEFSRRE